LGAIHRSPTPTEVEEPQPYGEAGHASPVQAQQTQNALKEASLVFVHAPAQSQLRRCNSRAGGYGAVLEMTPGSRIEAKLETQIRAQCWLGCGRGRVHLCDRRPHRFASRARVTGSAAGGPVWFVGVKFDEIELLDGSGRRSRPSGGA